jgi:hypothetical protein
MNNLPTVRIHLEGVQKSVVSAFADSHDELKEYTTKCIETAMTALREKGLEEKILRLVDDALEKAIYAAVEDAIPDALSEYFERGEGKDHLIKAMLRNLKREE